MRPPIGGHRQTGSAVKKAGPPKPPKHHNYEFTEPNLGGSQPLSRKPNGVPPPQEDIPPPLPSKPIPKKKDRLVSRGKDVLSPPPCSSPDQVDEARDSTPPPLYSWRLGSLPSSESLEQTHPLDDEPLYDIIVSERFRFEAPPPRVVKPEKDTRSTMSSIRKLFKSRTDEDGSESPRVRSSRKSLSSHSFRRSNSDRFKHRVSTLDTSIPNGVDKSVLQRTPSLDKLDDRMDRSVRLSIHSQSSASSSDDEEEDVVMSPDHGLPQPPESPFRTPASSISKARAGKSLSVFVSSEDEPLYQYINTAEFLTSAQRTEYKSRGADKTQLDVARQLSSRRLWCEQPEVITSGILQTLSDEEKKLQEAIFEVISSEATYLRSLEVLIEHFMEDAGMNPSLPEGRRVLDKRQHHVIFSNVREVRDISAKFLCELQQRQRESAVVRNISDIILDYAEHKFDCYIRYCTNQVYQNRELQECIENNVMLREYLKRLETHKRCQNLSMQSFLLLPMQRITRMPLLVLAILNRTPLDHPDHGLVESTLRSVQKLVTACNDGARKMERTEQLHAIHQKMDFRKLKPFPLVSASRQLERKGTVVRLQVEQKLFGKQRSKKTPLYLFAFNDCLVITKRKKDPKGDEVYKVVDHGSRALIEVEDIESHPGVTFPKHVFGEQETVAMATWAVSTANVKNAFLVILLDNALRQTEKYIFVAQNHTEKTRWMECITRPNVQKDEEKIYQHWDCPQVQAVYDYQAEQPDELDLQCGDIIKVYRKMADGWYEGERLRDLRWGWFPSNFAVEIENEHTRARNLRETHKLLSLQLNPEEYSARMQSIT